MGYEPVAHETEGQIHYWIRVYEGERNNCFSKIQQVGQKKKILILNFGKTQFNRHHFGFQSQCFLLLVGYNILPSSSSTNQNVALIVGH